MSSRPFSEFPLHGVKEDVTGTEYEESGKDRDDEITIIERCAEKEMMSALTDDLLSKEDLLESRDNPGDRVRKVNMVDQGSDERRRNFRGVKDVLGKVENGHQVKEQSEEDVDKKAYILEKEKYRRAKKARS